MVTEVSIETGKKKWITVRLESRPASRPGKDEAPASAAELPKAAVTPSPTVASPQPSTPGHGGGDSIITNSIGMKLVLIPAGEFLMGSPDSDKDAADDEKPQHRVRITRPFYLGATEVTVGQFRRFVEQTGYRTEAETDGKGGYGWNEAKANVRARSEVHLAQPRLRPDGRAPGGERELERRDRVLRQAERAGGLEAV